ncbi:hypothetical protein EDD17DRAFT_1667865 [Pisolithus thermaeus]|nr:hypothetical protein EV401DRAFT_2013889 [Pisolithus croceorrhizus]KAI6140952.1 hypothetical protein EDD17DRAFT_1667865 [Pisolithus thermaeus]
MYSRISLLDVCLKLRLDSEEDAEYIVGRRYSVRHVPTPTTLSTPSKYRSSRSWQPACLIS